MNIARSEIFSIIAPRNHHAHPGKFIRWVEQNYRFRCLAVCTELIRFWTWHAQKNTIFRKSNIKASIFTKLHHVAELTRDCLPNRGGECGRSRYAWTRFRNVGGFHCPLACTVDWYTCRKNSLRDQQERPL